MNDYLLIERVLSLSGTESIDKLSAHRQCALLHQTTSGSAQTGDLISRA
jgi:hypothetical protein